MSAKPAAYDPLAVADEIIVDALNIGIMCINDNTNESAIEQAILGFCAKYGVAQHSNHPAIIIATTLQSTPLPDPVPRNTRESTILQ